jgi:hypothetical protein
MCVYSEAQGAEAFSLFMHEASDNPEEKLFARRLRRFKLIFVPLLLFSLAGHLAAVWSQLSEIRGGYFDFVLYHSAARIVADGKGRQLFDLTLQKNYQKENRAIQFDRPLPFNHLPYELVIFLPLAKFSFAEAHVLWAAMNVFLLIAMLFRLASCLTALSRPLMVLMVLAFYPTLQNFKMGQDSLLTAYLLTETLIQLKQQRDGWAGCLLALGLYKPQFFLPIAAILFCQRRWRAIGGFAATTALLAGISLLMVGWDGLMELFALWLPMTSRGNVVWPELMINLRGLVYMLLSLVEATAATNLLTLAISPLLFLATLRRWRGDVAANAEGLQLRYSLAVAMTALVSFHLYSYDSLLLAIPVVLMLDHVLKERLQSMAQKLFLPLLILMFIPLLPNALLGDAVLAWWGLSLPFLFWFLWRETGLGSKRLPTPVAEAANPNFNAAL